MSTIEVAVAGRGIQVKQGYEKPSAGDVNTCEVSIAIESGGVWDSLPQKRVTFATRTASVTVDYAPTIAIPYEVMASPGALYLTLTGYDANGIEVARTHRMTYPIEVARAGADEGAEPSPATLDVVSRIDNIASTLEASETTRQEAFESAQNERSSAFQASMSEWQQDVAESVSHASNAATLANEAATNADTATMNANAAATEAHGAAANANEAAVNANETANTIKQRADSGEFNGEPGADGYSPTASVTKNGGTATITVTDKNGTTTATVSDGAPGSDAAATDVRIAGNSITVDGVANIPIASNRVLGVVAIRDDGIYGIAKGEGNNLFIVKASYSNIDTRNSDFRPIASKDIDYAVKAAMCDGKGEAWTAAEQAAAKKRMGIDTALVENILVGSETGTVAHVEDAFAGASMRKITVEGACKQDGTPSPDNPVPIVVVENPTVNVTGRNLLDASLLIMGHSVDSKDGHIYTTSTNKWYANVDFMDARPMAGKQVAASGLLAGKHTNFLFYDSNEKYISYSGDSKETFVFNVPENAELMRVDMHADVYGQGTASLELAPASGSYKPYTSQSLAFTLPPEHPYLAKLPDGTADEIVVDRNGNVSLIARVGKAVNAKILSAGRAGELDNTNGVSIYGSIFDDVNKVILDGIPKAPGAAYCDKLYSAKVGTENVTNAVYKPPSDVFVVNIAGAKDENDAKAKFDALESVVYVPIVEKHYQLGKIEMPKAQDSIVNAWTDAEITPVTSIKYVRDVNIVVANLESAIASIIQG